MYIKPSAAIRQNYNDIAELCKTTGEPVYLTKNGEGDLVVMDIEAFTHREKMLKLREELLAVEEDRLHGASSWWSMRHLPQGWMKNWRTNWFPVFVRRQSLWNDFRFAILCCVPRFLRSRSIASSSLTNTTFCCIK